MISTSFFLACLASIFAFPLSPVAAGDRDAWQHPDPRFAVIDQAADDDDFPAAQKLLAELRAEARRTKDQALLAEALEQGKEVTRLARDFDKVSKHLKTLDKDHPTACLAVGKYYCLVKSNWQRGLPLLALGDEPTLAALAADDTGHIPLPDDQAAIADRWWQYSQKVSDGNERIAYQLRAREWMIRARTGVDEKLRATLEQRLRRVPLFIDRIIIWNTHNGAGNDRGAEELLVSLLFQGKVVWKDAVSIPWAPNKPAYVMLRPRHVRADQVHVEITKLHERGAGLGEIEVVVGKTNIARSGEPAVDSYFEFNEAYNPSRLVDGDTSGKTGFWVADNGKDGWASIHFSEFSPVK